MIGERGNTGEVREKEMGSTQSTRLSHEPSVDCDVITIHGSWQSGALRHESDCRPCNIGFAQELSTQHGLLADMQVATSGEKKKDPDAARAEARSDSES